MPQAAIEIRGLTKRFKRFALGPLDLSVPEGSIYGFIGPNGAGKTTTIDLIFGMGAKDAGSISVLGLDHLRDEVAMKQQIGYASPDLLFQRLTKVGRIVRFVKAFYPSWDDTYCERLLTTFDLRMDDRIQALSLGARSKLSLLLALAPRPRLLILDEPTVGLDAISKQQVFAELLSVVRDEGRTVFISSHNLTDLERFADYVGMIRDGRLLFEGPTADVVDRFRVVDFTAPTSTDLVLRPGMVLQERAGNRCRVLLDSRLAPVDALSQLGAQQISESPVSLEDLFVALGR